MAAVLGHDAVRDREAEPCALPDGFGGEEGFEYSGEVLRRNSLAGGFDLNPKILLIRAGAYPKGAVPFDGMSRIYQQLHENLIELRQPTLDGRNVAVFLDDLSFVLVLVMHDVERAFQPAVEIRRQRSLIIHMGKAFLIGNDLSNARYALLRFTHEVG